MNLLSFDMMGPGAGYVILGFLVIVIIALFVVAVAIGSIIVLVILLRKKKRQNEAEVQRNMRQGPPAT